MRRNLERELIRDFENPEEADTPGDWKEYTTNIADSQPVKNILGRFVILKVIGGGEREKPPSMLCTLKSMISMQERDPL